VPLATALLNSVAFVNGAPTGGTGAPFAAVEWGDVNIVAVTDVHG
jgi:hypothetical protein